MNGPAPSPRRRTTSSGTGTRPTTPSTKSAPVRSTTSTTPTASSTCCAARRPPTGTPARSSRAPRALTREPPPRLGGIGSTGPLVGAGETVIGAARRLALELDGGVLAIQGPPGTGKTWTGARMILDLVRARRKVGITAQSHKAITNMLIAVDAAAREEGAGFRAIQRCDTGDVLVVSEAGQMSLANVVAMSGATHSFVLLGDPNQLPQVSPGVHPDGSGAAAPGHPPASAA